MPKVRRFVLLTLLVGFGGLLALAVAEVVLRVAPIPGVTFYTFYYDDVTGFRHYPNSTLIYRNARNDHVRRRVNSWGYLDRQHSLEKPPRPRWALFSKFPALSDARRSVVRRTS